MVKGKGKKSTGKRLISGDNKKGAKDETKHIMKGNYKPSMESNDQSIIMKNESVHKRKSKTGNLLVNGSSQIIVNSSLKEKLRLKKEREMIGLMSCPLRTLLYFFMECLYLLREFAQRLWNHKYLVTLLLALSSLLYIATFFPGPHQEIVEEITKMILRHSWWLWLGFLSSVGLGTGLHTFILYLGPHIAMVTMAADSCGSVDFPEPPYPDEILCPSHESSVPITIFAIMTKVWMASVMWGIGTALGELPPYFMARGARLSGQDPEDQELQDLEELQKLGKENPSQLSVLDRLKLSVEYLVHRVGFLGILMCASIPNPLFDLAGITCGHFLVPFWTFFGATLIGKAVFKVCLQMLFVIIMFKESLLEKAFHLVALMPFVGPMIQVPLRTFLDNQKQQFKNGSPAGMAKDGNIIGLAIQIIVCCMVIFFLSSIISSLARNYHKRIHKTVEKTKESE